MVSLFICFTSVLSRLNFQFKIGVNSCLFTLCFEAEVSFLKLLNVIPEFHKNILTPNINNLSLHLYL